MFEFSVLDFGAFTISKTDALRWNAVTMPGDSVQHLRNAGMETVDPNPFDNSRNFLKYEAMDFLYRTRFEAVEGKGCRLACDGLDAIADIYLNGNMVHESRSSFIRLDIDLTAQAKPGTNELIIHFISPTEHIKQHRPDFDKKSLNVLFDEKWRAYLRKPQWHYGWDNVGHLAGVGFIGEPQIIECAAPLHISNLLFDQQYDWKNHSADFAFRMDATVYRDCTIQFQLDYNGESIWQSEACSLTAEELILHPILGGHLDNVHEWNCVGLGDPNLYSLRVLAGTETLYQTAVGFRHVELSREVVEKRMLDYRVGSPDEGSVPDMDGGADITMGEDGQTFNGAWSHIKIDPYETEVEDFCVVLNGQRVFIEGFDWQPVEYSLSNVAPEKLQTALDKMADLNVNSVRIWGGAYIEDRAFYDFCDQHGIIVWQDFQFACSLYPDKDAFFRDLVAQEVVDIVKRLHNHPSVGVFCGSNEIDMMLDGKGLDVKAHNSIGHELIPVTLKSMNCPTPYHVSSPAGTEYPRHPFSGECRNWTAMTHVADDYAVLRADESIMVSEGGCAAYPDKAQCELFIRPEWDVHEQSLLEHQEYQIHAMNTYQHQHLIKPINIHETIRKHFGAWETLDELIYLSQLYQAEGLQRYVEIFRYKQQKMHGYYIWKFADSWPCFSLSILDYENQPKMAYHTLKRTMADLTICPFSDDKNYRFSVFSRKPERDLQLTVQTCTFSGEVLDERDEHISETTTGINHTSIALSKQAMEFYDLSNVVMVAQLTQQGRPIYERLYFPVPPRERALSKSDIRIHFEHADRTDGRFNYVLTLAAEVLSLGIHITPVKGGAFELSDNSLDMLPGTERKLLLRSTEPLAASDIIVQTYNQLGKCCAKKRSLKKPEDIIA